MLLVKEQEEEEEGAGALVVWSTRALMPSCKEVLRCGQMQASLHCYLLEAY